MSRWNAVSALLLSACHSGPVLYLGTPRDAGREAGVEDSGVNDAAERDADEDDVPCVAADDCAGLRREPHCHPDLLLCVECLTDDHCADDEHCDSDDGDCEDGR